MVGGLCVCVSTVHVCVCVSVLYVWTCACECAECMQDSCVSRVCVCVCAFQDEGLPQHLIETSGPCVAVVGWLSVLMFLFVVECVCVFWCVCLHVSLCQLVCMFIRFVSQCFHGSVQRMCVAGCVLSLSFCLSGGMCACVSVCVH